MAVVFDTLEYANRLERAGFSREQAAAQIQALVAVVSDRVATKADLEMHQAATRHELEAFQAAIRHDFETFQVAMRREFEAFQAAMRHEFEAFQASMRGELDELRVATKHDIDELRVATKHALLSLEHRLTVRLGGMLAVSVGLVAALVKLL